MSGDIATPFQNASEMFEQHELHRAMSILDEIIADNPADVPALLLRGRISYKRQQWGAAINDFSSVLEIDSENAEASAGIKMAYDILGYFTPDLFNP